MNRARPRHTGLTSHTESNEWIMWSDSREVHDGGLAHQQLRWSCPGVILVLWVLTTFICVRGVWIWRVDPEVSLSLWTSDRYSAQVRHSVFLGGMGSVHWSTEGIRDLWEMSPEISASAHGCKISSSYATCYNRLFMFITSSFVVQIMCSRVRLCLRFMFRLLCRLL